MALSELQHQLTHSTFEAWLARTQFVAFENGVFIIGVHNEYARGWLEYRLAAMIQRTLVNVLGCEVGVRFIVVEPRAVQATPITDTARQTEKTTLPAPEPPDLSPDDLGWYSVSAYASRFWRPLLGRVAWAVYEIVREADKRPPKLRTEWTPPRVWTAPDLAQDVPCGRQALTGTVRDGKPQPGAFDRLVALDVGQVRRQGKIPHVVYEISVRVTLPWLNEHQVAQLNENLRVKHARWLEKRGVIGLHNG